MAYQQNEPADVREVQTYLRRIAQEYPRIPQPAVDGIYGEKTEEAVRAFQEQFGLPVTGEVNNATWDALMEEYVRIGESDRPQPIFPFCPETGAIQSGDRGNTVRIVQAMLDTIADEYGNLQQITCNGHFGDETANAVMVLQKTFGIQPNGTVDCRTWNLLALTYNAYVGR